jgi:hypothetical protein
MQIQRMILLAGLLTLNTTIWGATSAPDPFLGKWELDVKASKYDPGTYPRRMTIEMTLEERGVHYHSETLPANGEIFHVDYTANYDGKPVMVTGDRGILLPVALTLMDPHHVKATYGRGFQTEATSDRTISEDGNTLTIITTSRDKAGQQHINTGVYRRDDQR